MFILLGIAPDQQAYPQWRNKLSSAVTDARRLSSSTALLKDASYRASRLQWAGAASVLRHTASGVSRAAATIDTRLTSSRSREASARNQAGYC